MRDYVELLRSHQKTLFSNQTVLIYHFTTSIIFSNNRFVISIIFSNNRHVVISHQHRTILNAKLYELIVYYRSELILLLQCTKQRRIVQVIKNLT